MPVSARIGAIALFLLALCAPIDAASAFGLRLGPVYLGLPTPGFHRHNRVARAEPESAELPQNDRPTLLYPILAWPSLDDGIFWPRTMSSLPFGYESIFAQAFAKYPPEHAADLCPYRDASADIAARIEREIAPSAAQKPLLDKLATALGQANGYLIKSCPTEIPSQPVARLQLMEGQIDAMIMALEIIRPPLQKFEQSLDDKQRAQFDGAGPAVGGVALACNSGKTGSAHWPLSLLERAVQPTDAQRQALANVEDAFNRAASGLAAECQGAVPPTASGRLEAAEARLDATWRAVQSIQVALANFQKDLSDRQNTQFNALEIASTR